MRLALNIVPRTKLASLSSQVRFNTAAKTFFVIFDEFQAFFYDWIDRTAFKNGKPLPEKIGSMQYFLHGYQGKFM